MRPDLEADLVAAGRALDRSRGTGGPRFSGGKQQRLALARLLLKAPSVVVLDEAAAHLDSESEVAIQRAFAPRKPGGCRCRSPTGSPRYGRRISS